MRATEIRRTFLDFFAARDHRVQPSASLISNDPTLLLTVAGMVPFKPYFLGDAAPPHPRLASAQKCARTLDIENVGLTTRHLTFFEMLGNFSFGDYFKRQAIAWAWELATEPSRGFGFDPERIWATIYLDDDEAEQLWLAETDLPASRLQRRDKEDNYWSTGGAGPCGPCSELYYDRGPEHGADGGPAADESRYLEFWNLVFMQYEQDAEGVVVGDLPAQNVDTGMGMERMAMLLQDVPNVYETDVLRPMLDRAVDLTGSGYGDDANRDVSLRVIAEHCRTSAFLIADGVLPSNEARGYVLRRMLRRVVRHARLLGHEGPVMAPMVAAVIETMGEAWPELVAQRSLVEKIAVAEEERFAATLRTGTKLLDEAVTHARAGEVAELPAETVFALHDTFGFPIDLTVEIAAEEGLAVDRDEFARLMEQQRGRGRSAARAGRSAATAEVYREAANRVGASHFTGYQRTSDDTRIGAMVVSGSVLDQAEEGDAVELLLPVTPFYAEGGGQLGDHGVVETETGRIEIGDTVSPLEGLVVHRGRVVAGEVRAGQDASARVDTERRSSITRGHTATHLLHATLKEVVGDHAQQAGSAIDAGRFRFDFPHFSSLSREHLGEVERVVNERIALGSEVSTMETGQDEARAMGATALFGEKYGDRVRVVRIGDYSAELCGGTHVHRTVEVGLFTILSEASIAANVRRIEATTGVDAFRFLSSARLVAESLAGMLSVPLDELPARVSALAERVRGLERQLADQRRTAVASGASALLETAESVEGMRIVAGVVEGADRDALKSVALDLRQRAGRSLVLLGSADPDGRGLLFAAVTPDAGVAAPDVLRAAAESVGGRGGGKGDTAQGGIPDASRLGDAIEAGRRTAREGLVGG